MSSTIQPALLKAIQILQMDLASVTSAHDLTQLTLAAAAEQLQFEAMLSRQTEHSSRAARLRSRALSDLSEILEMAARTAPMFLDDSEFCSLVDLPARRAGTMYRYITVLNSLRQAQVSLIRLIQFDRDEQLEPDLLDLV